MKDGRAFDRNGGADKLGLVGVTTELPPPALPTSPFGPASRTKRTGKRRDRRSRRFRWYGIGETPNVQAFRGTIIFEKSVLIGAQKSGYPNATFVSSLSNALATGMGANQSTVASATQGVVIP